MDWVRTNHIKPAVANMSLGGGFSSSMNTAANNLASAGVFLAVAAGNSNASACNYSPSSAATVTSVMSSTSSDAKSSFSNFGSCTHLYAPGSSIKADWLNGGHNCGRYGGCNDRSYDRFNRRCYDRSYVVA